MCGNWRQAWGSWRRIFATDEISAGSNSDGQHQGEVMIGMKLVWFVIIIGRIFVIESRM